MELWLNFRDIEYVSAVAKSGSITLASLDLHISQPALSIYLNKLEERLGVQLFNRIGKRFTLTYAGHCLLNGGTEILRLRDDLQGKMEEIVHGDKGQLKVGFPYIRGITLLPPVLKEYKRLHPQVDIQVYEDNADNLQRKVADGEIDRAFISQVLDDPALICREILSDPIVLYVPNDSSLVRKAIWREGFQYPWIDLNLCREAEFVSNFPAQKTYQISQRIFDDHGFQPKIVIQVQNQLTAIHLVATGYGAYLAPAYFSYNINFARSESPAMLSVGKERPYTMGFVAAWRKGLYPSKLLLDFVEVSQKAYSYQRFL